MMNRNGVSNLITRPMRRVQHIHLIGIGGSGMAGIAEVLLNLGYTVSGSDMRPSVATERLVRLGATVHFGHEAGNIAGADVITVSTAIGNENPEVRAAREARVPVVRRAEMLAELMRFRYGIAIAGTHGKTTTTSLVAAVLAEGGLDPTFVVGGKVKSADANARLGEGAYLVAEADESDASFLHLTPLMAAVTNIDADHLETYGGDFDRLRATFVEFLQRLPFYGLAVLCVDDDEVRELIPSIGRPTLTYAIDREADVRASALLPGQGGTHFEVSVRGGDAEELFLALPGRHNVLNALAAVAIARELDVEWPAIRKALAGFQGIGRRLEPHGELRLGNAGIQLIDDYGHHPRELAATFEAVRAAWPERRLVVVFQPHRYTRTRDLFDDFCAVLSTADALVLTEVYAAGEKAIPTADSRHLAQGIRVRGRLTPVVVQDVREVVETLPGVVADGDVVLTLGAGDVGGLPALLKARFGASS
jgi:UDP-N-acetylmuramate--alanine ligase